jgi:heterodisulfide reductase subunit A-like polyferredoxin
MADAAQTQKDRINCYDWITATRRKGHAMMSTIAVIGPGVSGSARAFELADAGAHGVPVRHARLLSC